jgi:spermidine synthase
VASDTLDAAALPPALLRQRLAERRLPDLRYYNAEVHPALFALPGYYRDLVQPAPAAQPREVRYG